MSHNNQNQYDANFSYQQQAQFKTQAGFTPGQGLQQPISSDQDFPTLGGSQGGNNDDNSQAQNQQWQQTGFQGGQQMTYEQDPNYQCSGQGSSGLLKTAAAPEFNIVAKEFTFTQQAPVEEFPDLDQAFAVKKSKKPTKEELEAQKKKEQEATPFKGKPTMFFYVPRDIYGNAMLPLNWEQILFITQFYPGYAFNENSQIQQQNQIMCLDYLYGEAYRIDEEKARQAQEAAHAAAYNKGPSGQYRNKNYNNEDDYDEEYGEDVLAETNFGYNKNKKKNLGQKTKSEEVKSKPLKAKDPEKVAKQEEVKKSKVVKDVVVKVDEQTIVKVNMDKQPCSMVFIGHVDAGKSTISGQIMLLMGCVDERTIAKYKQEAKEKGRDSWWLAYCMDIGEEEKAKGKTVEVGRATFATKTKEFTVFDAPGHKNYVPNMIMGAALADYGGLVVSARKGEYEAGFEKEGQTREHVQLAKSLGVQKLIVVVNKMDDQSVNWSEARWNEIKTNIAPFLIKSGYAETDFQFVPISGLTGQNINQSVSPDVCSWYKGPTLIDALDQLPNEPRNPTGPLRIPILDKMQDQGVVIHGKIESGTLNIGDKIQIWPQGYPAQVGSILDHKNASVMFARPGENVQIKLLHIEDEKQISKGDVITMRENSIPVTMLFEAELDILELLDYKPIMSKGYTCIMHCHTFSDECVIKDLLEAIETDEKSGKTVTKELPKFTKSFAKCRVRISTRNPIAIEKYETIPALGRFTLRDEGKTIAVGRITKYKPHKTDSGVVVPGSISGQSEQQKPAMTEVKPDKNATLVFDLETGTTTEAGKNLEAVTEGDSDEDEN